MNEILIHSTRWVTMQPLNSEGNVDSLHKVVTMQPLNSEGNVDSLHKVGHNAASE